jgi:hypothetical protein
MASAAEDPGGGRGGAAGGGGGGGIFTGGAKALFHPGCEEASHGFCGGGGAAGAGAPEEVHILMPHQLLLQVEVVRPKSVGSITKTNIR